MSTTRIVDLPENITTSITPSLNPSLENITQNAYIPMNVHPNPYGNSQPPIMSPPQQQQPQYQQQMPQYLSVPTSNQLTPDQQMMLQNMPQNRLPSRDIQMDTTIYSNDEQIQPNYIPKVKLSNDFISEYEDLTEKKLEKHEQEQHRQKMIDIILTELQIPIFISILYFFFQLPIVNSAIFKKLSFLSLYNSDGNINFNGLLLKSIIFGCLFYFSMKLVTYISEI